MMCSHFCCFCTKILLLGTHLDSNEYTNCVCWSKNNITSWPALVVQLDACLTSDQEVVATFFRGN